MRHRCGGPSPSGNGNAAPSPVSGVKRQRKAALSPPPSAATVAAAHAAAAAAAAPKQHPAHCQCPACSAARVARGGPPPDPSHPYFGCPKCRFLPEGCGTCRGGPSVKKSATWRPAEGRRPPLAGEVKTYYPTEEEFLVRSRGGSRGRCLSWAYLVGPSDAYGRP